MKFPVSDAKLAKLVRDMKELGIEEQDLVENFIRGSGAGGQKINKTSSCVQLKHTPSGIEIKCQDSRSQALNRFFARRELCDRYREQMLDQQSKEQQRREKIKRQKRRRSRRQKEKILADKAHRGSLKKSRSKPDGE